MIFLLFSVEYLHICFTSTTIILICRVSSTSTCVTVNIPIYNNISLSNSDCIHLVLFECLSSICHSIFLWISFFHRVQFSVKLHFPGTQNSKNMFCLVYVCCRGRQTMIRYLMQTGSRKLRLLCVKTQKWCYD